MQRLTPVGFPAVDLLQAGNGELWAVATIINKDYNCSKSKSTFTRRLEDLDPSLTRLTTTPELQVNHIPLPPLP
jgi:hypothetical protein